MLPQAAFHSSSSNGDMQQQKYCMNPHRIRVLRCCRTLPFTAPLCGHAATGILHGCTQDQDVAVLPRAPFHSSSLWTRSNRNTAWMHTRLGCCSVAARSLSQLLFMDTQQQEYCLDAHKIRMLQCCCALPFTAPLCGHAATGILHGCTQD